eukprot:SAG22_NODE_432_length_10559_cov_29.404225_12_plen_86_part_00
MYNSSYRTSTENPYSKCVSSCITASLRAHARRTKKIAGSTAAKKGRDPTKRRSKKIVPEESTTTDSNPMAMASDGSNWASMEIEL